MLMSVFISTQQTKHLLQVFSLINMSVVNSMRFMDGLN